MALFRNLAARPQLTELCRARASPLFLISLNTATLLYDGSVPQRGIIPTPRTAIKLAHSSFLGYTYTKCPVSRAVLSYSSRHWLHTQSVGCLTDKAGEKKPKTRERQKSDEHGSVLNELMSIKAEDQPKHLTVGAKGISHLSQVKSRKPPV